ncbi:uncharacterized protein Z518_01985 [Rhinocladiella mackenziei CBS 650.93]|uniref:aldehyde dehydrogenase (NAD(+)) n=1 Tax=Rhinocladiella mackenziei CBS 650.93 TaxID=1442369 RepID=A0A0D2FYD9_9EURO|nr:uncharacterized protein Z518_01985 [Rhinocladiella mackenziei CBS 650.93]KIX07332.1 hypothetical protein Z518_01985 [Rhinocladiella mackenziei CBS 650.93]
MTVPLLNTLPKIEECMPKNLNLYYNGAWHKPQDGEYRETWNPGDGTAVAKVAFAGAKDTEAALQAAQKAFPAWRAVPPLERGKLLKKAAQVIREHATELAMLDALNIGSPITTMAGDALVGAENIEFFAGLIPAVTGETMDLGEATFNYTLREPLGVVARIVASNHPLMFTASKLAPTLAMGNTIVTKTPEQAPLSALRLAELIGGIFPPGVLNILSGGVECGKTLSSHPIVNKITLIGSLPTGRAIQKASADTLKMSAFELGGKNALIAYPDANIDRLVDGVVAGMNWAWCGQSCGSTSRVFLHESLHDHVLASVKEKLEKSYKPGNPLDPKTTMGSMVSKAAQDRVLRYIQLGHEGGARLVTGGKPPTTEDTKGGYFVEPTIFADVKQSMTIASEEIFGPVMSVLKWTDEAEMFEQVNSVEYGLTGSIYTTNMSTAQRAVRKVQAGTVWVNTVGTHFYSMPFGGYKQSGIGREDCFDELVSMTQCKAVHVKL